MPHLPARLLVLLLLLAGTGCSTINLKGVKTAANWRKSDADEIRDKPGSVTVNQSPNGKDFSFSAVAVPPR